MPMICSSIAWDTRSMRFGASITAYLSIRTTPVPVSTPISGKGSSEESTRQRSTCVWARADARSGCRQLTPRCRMPKARTQKVVKLATDVTEQRRARANDTAKIEAIEKSMAVIEFNTDGTILRANDVFLDLMGYESHEIEGKHHRIFVSTEFGGSKEYAEFWLDLARGKFHCGRFERLTKTRRVSLAPSHLLADPGSQRKACKGSQIRIRHHRADPTGCRT